MLATIRKWFSNTSRTEPRPAPVDERPLEPAAQINTVDFNLRPDDPFLTYLLGANGVVEIDRLHLNSPALLELKGAGVKICVPLVSQGELIGLLNLGPRRSEQEYSADDRRLLATLATQAAPALRVAQLAQQQQIEARQRERIDQELRVARVIQQTLLPKEVPSLPGWKIAPFWQPARAVSGDFYDFISYPDGKLGIVIADVTDKGVPAALVMATTRSIIRSCAERSQSPGDVLGQANDLLYPDIPPKMFVTCLYALLDPHNGQLLYANAGHNLPYLRTSAGLVELRARGMPLGLMPGMPYEEKITSFAPGETLLLSSDGLVEAHNPQREMFGFPRLKELMSGVECSADLVRCLMQALETFTGPNYEQEDDITLLVIEREAAAAAALQNLAEFDITSQPGNERQAAAQVLASLSGNELSQARLKRLETAVAEATMNAMEHGNHYSADLPVHIAVLQSPENLVVRISDHGGDVEIPDAESPDLDAKLAGLQSPRGWGLFLIKNMVDEMNISRDSEHHVIELVLKIKEGSL
ncbi:MAG: SpoIIE family protein phosphatase [Anaerolineaceae bacterium]|nr:SpoIIE family protein phosphatase [Anaerolineaceae bacterium]